MAPLATFFALLPLFKLIHAATVSYDGRPTDLTWGPCADGRTEGVECATAQVPLDWLDLSKGTITLSVIRLPAKTSPREGYMFYNFGGPAVSGVTTVEMTGANLQAQLGAGYDIVSWDVRGVGGSGPTLKLFTGDDDYIAFWNRLQGHGTIADRGNLTQRADVDFFMSQVPAFDNLTSSLGDMMLAKNGDTLKYVGTCATVRDLVYLVDTMYGKGADVNYFGTSYGTVLGTYLTQMFPNRVGKVILDGVFDPYKHSNLPPIAWIDTDSQTLDVAMKMWAEACAAYPESCPTASLKANATSADILNIVNKMLDTAYRNYDGFAWNIVSSITIPNPVVASHWSWEYLAQQVTFFAYGGEAWDWVDIPQFVNAQNNNTHSTIIPRSNPVFHRAMRPSYTNYVPTDFLDHVSIAIYCGDTVDPKGETTKDLFKGLVRASQSHSTLAAALMGTYQRLHCHRWKARAVERLPGRMEKKPKNVVLIMGNTGDPITPFSSSKRLASAEFFGNKARLVKFKALGHGTSSFPSRCIDNVVQKFIRGQPPKDAKNDEADVVCTVDSTPYGPPPATWNKP